MGAGHNNRVENALQPSSRSSMTDDQIPSLPSPAKEGRNAEARFRFPATPRRVSEEYFQPGRSPPVGSRANGTPGVGPLPAFSLGV